MADRAFDRYGRILGSTGYDYVITRLEQGFPPEAIVDRILDSHPQFARSEVQTYVQEGISAKDASDKIMGLLQGETNIGDLEHSEQYISKEQWDSFYQLNPNLFGSRSEGDRFKYTFEFGQGIDKPLIKTSVTSPAELTWIEALHQAYLQAVEICRMYPGKFGLKSADDCDLAMSRFFAPERKH